MQENNHEEVRKGGKSISELNIPPNPNSNFYNCRQINQNAMRGEHFWILDFQKKNVESNDGKVTEKYVLKCKRNLEDSDDFAFKIFTGSVDIKYKMDVTRERDEFPVHGTLVGDGRNFDFV